MFNPTHTITAPGYDALPVELSGPDMQANCRSGEVHVYMESGTAMLVQQRELSPIATEPADAYGEQVAQGQARMVERFVRLISPKREPKRVTEDDDYLAMLDRQIRALEARACGNAELLPQIVRLQERLAEVVNVAIATNAARYKINKYAAPSEGECARALGITRQSANERSKRGREIIAKRLAAANGITFSEAKRERAERERVAAAAAPAFEQYRGRHLRAVS